METYKTAEVARYIGIHPNTVRLYERLGLVSAPERRPNGYRVFSKLHLMQFELARTALKVEVLQNGLRKKAIDIIKGAASCDVDGAIRLTESYIRQIRMEQANAEEAITITEHLLSGDSEEKTGPLLTRRETAELLQITIDALRNWEMNGLLTVKRKQNGYRVYDGTDIRRLKIIRTLRCANYSHAAILRMLNAVTLDSELNIREVIDTPGEHDDIISVCDKLLSSLTFAETNAGKMLSQLKRMKDFYKTNPPL